MRRYANTRSAPSGEAGRYRDLVMLHAKVVHGPAHRTPWEAGSRPPLPRQIPHAIESPPTAVSSPPAIPNDWRCNRKEQRQPKGEWRVHRSRHQSRGHPQILIICSQRCSVGQHASTASPRQTCSSTDRWSPDAASESDQPTHAGSVTETSTQVPIQRLEAGSRGGPVDSRTESRIGSSTVVRLAVLSRLPSASDGSPRAAIRSRPAW